MRWLGSLDVGDRFKFVFSEESDMRGVKHPPVNSYRITKVYPQKPFVRVTESLALPGTYSFLPGIIVRDPNEPQPDNEAIRRFLEPKLHRTVVGYELLWDGVGGPGLRLTPKVRGLLEAWLSVAPATVERNYLYFLLNSHYDKFCGEAPMTLPSKMLQFYSRRLSDLGLIRVLYAEDDYARSNDKVKRSENVFS